jgi:hypothetical protein
LNAQADQLISRLKCYRQSLTWIQPVSGIANSWSVACHFALSLVVVQTTALAVMQQCLSAIEVSLLLVVTLANADFCLHDVLAQRAVLLASVAAAATMIVQHHMTPAQSAVFQCTS